MNLPTKQPVPPQSAQPYLLSLAGVFAVGSAVFCRGGGRFSVPQVGTLPAGSVIEVLEALALPNGTRRVRCSKGWTSVKVPSPPHPRNGNVNVPAAATATSQPPQ